ncbi:MAG: hypothetical protein MJA82_02530 [Clostridia bacterium]|nr:hypothetical protein [Clostridia bacterium]
MKKKILSLLLVVSLMFVFTTSVFASTGVSIANTGNTAYLNIYPGKSQTININSKDLDCTNDTLSIGLILNTPYPQYTIMVYDTTENKVVSFKQFNDPSLYYSFGRIIDCCNNYQIIITNVGDTVIEGNALVVVK